MDGDENRTRNTRQPRRATTTQRLPGPLLRRPFPNRLSRLSTSTTLSTSLTWNTPSLRLEDSSCTTCRSRTAQNRCRTRFPRCL